MKIEEALIKLRDDLKEWVTNNLNAVGKPKASDVSINTPSGMTSTDVQGAVVELNKKIAIVECVSPNVKDTYVHLSYPNGFNQNNCVIIGLNSRKWRTWYCESITNGVFGISASLKQEVIDVGVVKEDGFNLPVKVVLCKMS